MFRFIDPTCFDVWIRFITGHFLKAFGKWSLFDSLIRLVDSMPCFDSWNRFMDSIHWFESLTRFVDSFRCFDSLLQFTPSMHWFDSSNRSSSALLLPTIVLRILYSVRCTVYIYCLVSWFLESLNVFWGTIWEDAFNVWFQWMFWRLVRRVPQMLMLLIRLLLYGLCCRFVDKIFTWFFQLFVWLWFEGLIQRFFARFVYGFSYILFMNVFAD